MAHKKANEVHENASSKAHIQSGYARINPFNLAEQADVSVMSQPLDKLLGAFLREARTGILINSERPLGMMHMTCAHELGHFHLGHLTTTDQHFDYGDNAESTEQEANQFAYSLIAPRWLILHAMKAKKWGYSDLIRPAVIYQLSLRLGVSYSAMVWQLARLKLLSIEAAPGLARIQPKKLKIEALPGGIAIPPKADVWLLDQSDKDWVIEPRSTDIFIVSLPSNTSSGYVWSADELRTEGFTLEPVLVDGSDRPASPRPTMVGGYGESLYLLNRDWAPSETEPISAELLLRESQPWNKASSAAEELALAMRFERQVIGLSDGTRKREVGVI